MSWHHSLSKKHQVRKSNKYGAEKVKDGARTYDSKMEYEMHAVLKLMERAGQVRNIRHHPAAIQLTEHVTFKIDYIVYDTVRATDIGVEVKGMWAERFRVICQLWPEFGPFPMQVWGKRFGKLFMLKEIKGK